MLKTWEVNKIALENAEAKFKRLRTGGDTYVVREGYIEPVNKRDNYRTIQIDEDWELVHEPVTWREGIQAWLDGKTVYYEINGTKSYLTDESYLRVTPAARPISRDELSRCKWFVE